MNRFTRALVAGTLTGGLLSLIVFPSAALGQKPPSGGKPATAKTTTKATVAKPAASHAAAVKAATTHATTTHAMTPRGTIHTTTHATTHAAVPHVTTHTTTRTTTHTTTHTKAGSANVRMKTRATTQTKTHVTTHVKTGFAMPVKTHVTFTRQTVVKLRGDSIGRLQSFARSAPKIGHFRVVPHTAFARFKVRHAPLRNVTFLTGYVVSRTPREVIVRTADGLVPIMLTPVAVVPTIFVPGQMVVVPAQFVNNGFTLVPAYTTADENALAAGPALAPCAINDRDGDDAGDTSYYAPVAACYNNDGDADDGYVFGALPQSFAPAPSYYSTSYAPVVASGFVVTQSGSNVVIMTSNFTPMVVNASAAMAAGATNGPLTAGRYVTVYGYDVNNGLVATSFM